MVQKGRTLLILAYSRPGNVLDGAADVLKTYYIVTVKRARGLEGKEKVRTGCFFIQSK
jgi:hypothetical protein